MHGPQIELRRRKGEELVAAASVLTIRDKPLCCVVHADTPAGDFHAATFERLSSSACQASWSTATPACVR